MVVGTSFANHISPDGLIGPLTGRTCRTARAKSVYEKPCAMPVVFAPKAPGFFNLDVCFYGSEYGLPDWSGQSCVRLSGMGVAGQPKPGKAHRGSHRRALARPGASRGSARDTPARSPQQGGTCRSPKRSHTSACLSAYPKNSHQDRPASTR